MYCGERDGEHWYLIGGEHEVPVSQIVDINPADDDQKFEVSEKVTEYFTLLLKVVWQPRSN